MPCGIYKTDGAGTGNVRLARGCVLPSDAASPYRSRMGPSFTDTLCKRCGLCCDGSLFADVELTGHVEATGLEVLGLEIDDDDADGALLLQPCLALKGTRCGIYALRPECCRTFECRVLQEVRRGTVAVERARAQIAGARKRIKRAGRGDSGAEAAISALEVSLRKTFLDGDGPSPRRPES
jgi:uncharacterized protein